MSTYICHVEAGTVEADFTTAIDPGALMVGGLRTIQGKKFAFVTSQDPDFKLKVTAGNSLKILSAIDNVSFEIDITDVEGTDISSDTDDEMASYDDPHA